MAAAADIWQHSISMPPVVSLIRLAIVGVWAALLIALASAHLPEAASQPGTALPPPAAQPLGDELWSGVYMKGSKIGYGRYSSAPSASGGLHIEETSMLRLTVLDRPQTVRAEVVAEADADYALRSFAVSLTSDLGTFAARGTIDGGQLALKVDTGGEQTEQRVPLSEPLFLPAAARARLRGAHLQPGTTLTVQAFDASAMQHQPMTLHVVGRETLTIDGVAVPTWKVHESFRGMETDVWLDEGGRMLRERGPMGLEVRRESAADALAKGWSDSPLDLMGAVAVPVAAPIAAPGARRQLRLRFTAPDGVQVPPDARQQISGDELTITREAIGAATYRLPYSDDPWRGELQPTVFLQSDHPRVRAAAQAVVGDERDPLAAAERLRRWVHDELEKRPAATLPNALQVLETRAGDCNEHAVLFAALARAAGLPARVVAGLVYQDGAFLYHAWNEVWIGSGWVSVDATFDQLPADVTHIKLVEGGPETHAALVPMIGKVSISVLPERG